MKLAHRPADYVVQNLPPGSSDPATDSSLVLETNKILSLAHAWGQMEVAESALSNAYEVLKDFDKQELPVRTLQQRMKKLRDVAKEMAAMADQHEGLEDDEEEA